MKRDKYYKLLFEFRKTHQIILITGLHGSGKSVLLSEISRELRNEKPPVRIVQVESNIENGRQLLSEARALGVGPSALFIDNAERIDDIASALSEICIKYTVTVFLTGKHTSVLESRLKPSLESLIAVVRLNPFCYREFLDTFSFRDSRKTLEMYSTSGGLPETSMVSPDSPHARAFLTLRANAFLLTEIIEMYPVRNPLHIKDLLVLAAQSTGKTLSARTICAYFSEKRTTISPQAALDYLHFCQEAGILVSIPILDIKDKKILDSGGVWYFGDNGLRSAFVPKESLENSERAIENLILLHLIDTGWTIFQGRVDLRKQLKETVHFVCEKNEARMYIQVNASSASFGEKLRRREALLSIRDAWPKYILSAEADEENTDGIRTLSVRNFLLD